MKKQTLSAFALTLFLAAGCAGITDANLSDVQQNTNALNPEITHPADLRVYERTRQDAPVILDGGDEQIIIRPPREDDRE
jgi:hypothetical protein